MKTKHVGIMDTDVKTIILEQGSKVRSIEKKKPCNRLKPKIALEDKVYLETYYIYQLGSVVMDETLTKIKAQKLHITKWMLIEDQQLMKFNLGTNVE
jgi:hypothetical protein